MTREADASRKPVLLAQILDYLLDKPLATLSFRTVAKALDVSTFTLVYHFGSRAQLLSDIVAAIAESEQDIEPALREDYGTVDAYFKRLERSWEWSVEPRNQKLQRLQFEASMMEVLDPDHTFSRELHADWLAISTQALRSLGLSEADAELESRLLIDTVFGIQYDLVVNQDVERATAAFRHMMAAVRTRVDVLLAQPGSSA
ncbi:TetR/AcrR family transcriptional regulator [Homoserinimonas sp. A447]